jgi:hypothetical protein
MSMIRAQSHTLRATATGPQSPHAGICCTAPKFSNPPDQATRRDQPSWLTYFDEAYFAAKIAHCFHTLGQGQQTEQYALRSLQMNPRYIRGKAFNTALLALAYAQQGELDSACIPRPPPST